MALEKLLDEEMRKQKFTDEPGMLGPEGAAITAPYIPGTSPFRVRQLNERPEAEVLRAQAAGTPLWMPRDRQAALEAYGYEEGPEGLGFFSPDKEGMETWTQLGTKGREPFEITTGEKEIRYIDAFNQGKNTYEQLLQGQLPKGWIPLTSDIPTFEDWIAAQGPGYMPRGDNTPYYEYFKAHFQLPHYGSMTSLLRDLGSVSQPITERLMDFVMPGPLNKYAGILMPGNPESVARAAAANEWSVSPEKLYGPTATSWDYLGGGELAEDPEMRALGRQAGTAIGSYFLGGALSGALTPAAGAAGGAAGGAAAGASEILAQPVVQSAIQGAAQGAVQAAMTGQNIFEGAMRGTITGSAGGGAVSLAGMDDALYNAVLRGATQGATAAAVNGGDTQQILEAAAMGAVSAYGSFKPGPTPVSPGQPLLEEAMRSAPSFESVTAGIPAEGFTPTIMARTPGELSTISEEIASGIQARTPYELQSIMAEMSPLVQTQLSPGLLTFGLGEPTTTDETMPTVAPIGGPVPTEEAAPAAPKESSVDFKQAAEYVKTGKKLYDLYQQLTGGEGRIPGFDVPPHTTEMTDEEYYTLVGERAVDYLGLDPEEMRKQGLVPGTPEYLEYIMQRADELIEAIYGEDAASLGDETADDMKAALRNLSEKEMEQLARALYTRGTLGMVTASPEGVDPFTGISEELGMLPGEFVAGDIAAAQRGYARSLERLARLPGAEAREDLRGMLGRNIDVFGLQAQATQKDVQRSLIEKAQSELQRRGLRPDRIWDQSPDFWRDIIEQLSPEEYEYLMRLLEGVA